MEWNETLKLFRSDAHFFEIWGGGGGPKCKASFATYMTVKILLAKIIDNVF